jgi:helix-turn-helix protein
MMAKVWELDLPQPLKLLALAMADFADDDGDGIFPSIEYIAWKVGAVDRTVQRQLRVLEGSGILEVIAVKGIRHPNGRWTRLWAIHPERGDKLTPLVRMSPNDATGVKRRRLGRQNCVTQSISYPLDIRAFEISEPEIPRLPGESHKDYMLRVAETWGTDRALDTVQTFDYSGDVSNGSNGNGT